MKCWAMSERYRAVVGPFDSEKAAWEFIQERVYPPWWFITSKVYSPEEAKNIEFSR